MKKSELGEALVLNSGLPSWALPVNLANKAYFSAVVIVLSCFFNSSRVGYLTGEGLSYLASFLRAGLRIYSIVIVGPLIVADGTRAWPGFFGLYLL